MLTRYYSTLAKQVAKKGTAPPLPFKVKPLSFRLSNSNNKSNSKTSKPDHSKALIYKRNKAGENEIKLGTSFNTVVPKEIKYEPVKPLEGTGEVPKLAHNLDRVLFSPGVHFLQDPRTRVYNFTPFLKKIMPVSEFDFSRISLYITASRDQILNKLTKELSLKYYSSTSSMTSLLLQFHFWLSNERPANIINLSKNFHGLSTSFSTGTRCPTVLMCKNQNGVYSIDADKSSDKEILLSLLGHSMEKLLTTPPEIFKNYHIENSHKIPKDQAQESYHYARIGNFLMRSQLDCYDPRLPGTGTFDLKTRLVCAVRHDISHTEKFLTGYKIFKNNGVYESFEREFFELIRSALLKYSLQARIGNMDGIFVCYHNIQDIFGFQYLPLQDIDYIFHSIDDELSYRDSSGSRPNSKLDIDKIQGPIGEDNEDLQMKLSSYIAELEFKASIDIWSKLLDTISQRLKGQSFRLVLKNDIEDKLLYAILTPLTNEKIDEIQNLGDKSSEEQFSDEQDKLNKHRAEFQAINKETSGACVGFKLVRKHFFNGKESNQTYYKPKLTDDWQIGYKISGIDKKTAVEKYLKFLKEKEDVVWRSNDEDLQIQIEEYLRILRAFGDKGKLREEIWKKGDEELKVWQPIQNDKDV